MSSIDDTGKIVSRQLRASSGVYYKMSTSDDNVDT